MKKRKVYLTKHIFDLLFWPHDSRHCRILLQYHLEKRSRLLYGQGKLTQALFTLLMVFYPSEFPSVSKVPLKRWEKRKSRRKSNIKGLLFYRLDNLSLWRLKSTHTGIGFLFSSLLFWHGQIETLYLCGASNRKVSNSLDVRRGKKLWHLTTVCLGFTMKVALWKAVFLKTSWFYFSLWTPHGTHK